MNDLATQYFERLKPYQESLPELVSAYKAVREEVDNTAPEAKTRLLALDRAFFQLTKDIQPPTKMERMPSIGRLAHRVIYAQRRANRDIFIVSKDNLDDEPKPVPSFWTSFKKYPKEAFRDLTPLLLFCGSFAAISIYGSTHEVATEENAIIKWLMIGLGIFIASLFLIVIPLHLSSRDFIAHYIVGSAWYRANRDYEKLKKAFDEAIKLREAAINANLELSM